MSKYVCKAFVWEYYILIWIKSLPTIHLNSFSSLHFLLLYLFLSFLFLLLVLFPLHLLLSLCLWNQLLGYKKVSLISFFLFFGVLFVFFSTSCGIFEKKKTSDMPVWIPFPTVAYTQNNMCSLKVSLQW